MRRSIPKLSEKPAIPPASPTTQASVEPSPKSPTTATPRPTLKRIAEQAKVSVATVSRVLNGQSRHHRISPETEALVKGLAGKSNFVPNQIARGLRLRKTLTVGLIIPDISNPFFASIARQVALGARKHGYSILLCDSQETLDLEIEAIRLLSQRHVDGMVLCPVGQSSTHLAPMLAEKLPIVLVDRYFTDIPMPGVAADNLAGAREATEYLIANGHRKIACLQGLRGTTPNVCRLKGYKEALIRNGITVDESLIVGDSFGEQSGYIETKLLFRTRRDITAILAFSNLIALGALRAIAEEKLRIPEDVSIISFDDQPYAAHLATPLTTVAQPHAEMGDVAIKLLFDQISAPHRISKGALLLPTTLVIRKSVSKIQS